METLFKPDALYNSEILTFIDDNFTADKTRIENLSKGLLNLKEKLDLTKKFTYACMGNIEDITEDLLITMKNGGCIEIFFGIESGSEKILNFLKRNYTPDDVIRVVTLCKNMGIHTVTSFMLGLPYETKEDMEQTFSLIEKLPGNTGINIFTALPGTPVFNNAAKYNLTIAPHLPEEDDLEQFAYISNEYFTKEDVMNAYYKALGIHIRKSKRNYCCVNKETN